LVVVFAVCRLLLINCLIAVFLFAVDCNYQLLCIFADKNLEKKTLFLKINFAVYQKSSIFAAVLQTKIIFISWNEQNSHYWFRLRWFAARY
jgi:hypothetical protein